MKEDINLASTGKAETKVKKKWDPVLIIFGAFFIISLIIIATSIILSAISSSLTSQSDALKSTLSKSDKKQKISIVSERLSFIQNILTNKSLVDTTAAKVAEAVPTNFELNSISADETQIKVSLTSGSLFDFANFLEEDLPKFISKNKSTFASVSIDGFSQNKSGYILSLFFKVIPRTQ